MEEKVEQVQKQNQVQNEPLIHNFNKESLKAAFTPKVMVVLIVVIVVGFISGYLLSNRNSSTSGGKTLGGILNTSSVPKER